MRLYLRYCALALLTIVVRCRAFDIVREYSGATFFDRWDFYGYWDNLTLGNVWWLNETEATATHLAYISDQGTAVMKVDNTSILTDGQDRNSIRITSQDFYDYGSLWVVDLLHVPYGCSVWPAFWTKGALWPNDGEIDIIEAINMMDHNQMALHTTDGCIHESNITQTGFDTATDCGKGSGCVVGENKPNSYNSGFAAAGGGVWATQFDYSGIYIWFWSRPDIPPSITQANSTSSIDISQWGPPSAAYPTTNSCNITNFFTPQQLIFDITLCGDWAGVPGIYNSDPICKASGTNGTCYGNNVLGSGSPTFDNAYFEVNYVRAYTTGAPQPTSSAPSSVQIGAVPTTIGGNDLPGAAQASVSGSNTNTNSPSPTNLTNKTSSASSVFSLGTALGVIAVIPVVSAIVVDLI